LTRSSRADEDVPQRKGGTVKRMGVRAALAQAVLTGSLMAVPPPAYGASSLPTHFSNVPGSSGIHVAGLGNASSWIDYEGDGDLDLFATNSDFSARSAPRPESSTLASRRDPNLIA
jgi:hypothetical protein